MRTKASISAADNVGLFLVNFLGGLQNTDVLCSAWWLLKVIRGRGFEYQYKARML